MCIHNILCMEKLTISIPDELKKKIEKNPEINWAIYMKEKFFEIIKLLSKIRGLN